MSGKWYKFLKSLLLPVLTGIYPVIFLYCHNVSISKISSLKVPLALMVGLAVVLFAGYYLVTKRALRSGLSASVGLIFFHTYGWLYTKLLEFNIVQVEHYTLLPLVIFCALYAAFFLGKLRAPILRRIRDVSLLLLIGLILFNIIPAVPVELKKAQAHAEKKQVSQAANPARSSYPDIYYLIFDEYAGFDALSGYWHYEGYKGFQKFLEDNGFYVDEHSYSPTHDTIIEMASRLNMKLYPKSASPSDLFGAISDNKVMQILKSYGYTTVVFDGPKMAYVTKTPITADYNFTLDPNEAAVNISDEFSILFYNQTMLRVFSNFYESRDTSTIMLRRMTKLSLEKVTDLAEVPSPKFVYMHVMLPHLPILYDENGLTVDIKNKLNWNYYLGQHKYTTKLIQSLISTLLSQSDPNHPPVIVLQSDHGARNLENKSGDGVNLMNYPDEYKRNIINALYLPGYDTSQIPDDLAPIDTFPIILNFYLDANVSVEK